ncbi:uncharacterized protein I206_100757 [Kwoniella pini CBS 10737]|uniref:Uncharacterized protein n=1 Tax=Kwoniella pini CBS 10737 TaxID=1296096 RepID=A0A1B9ICB7_9TREE|nr:uncharacterized protein I206_00570 [Kwoniella pini CBS 10737]OCF53269.1 hypothetical protein I206_00570 [Kwoniella pini CBS 10737]
MTKKKPGVQPDDMKPKRERSNSHSITPPPSSQKYNMPKYPSEGEDHFDNTQSSETPTPPQKKPGRHAHDLGPSTPSKEQKKTDTTSSPGKGIFPIEAKKVLLERAVDLAYKSLPYRELAEELGISESRLKDQFKPGRHNLRKSILDIHP